MSREDYLGDSRSKEGSVHESVADRFVSRIWPSKEYAVGRRRRPANCLLLEGCR